MTHDKTTGLDPNVLGAESYAEALGSLDKLHSYVMCSVSWAHDDGSQFNEVCSLFNTIRAALQSAQAKAETVDLDAMRDHFEKWMTANGDYPHLIHKHFGGNYLREETSMKWDGFKQGVKYAQR